MQNLKAIITLARDHVQYDIARKATQELANLTELVSLCRNDVFTDAWEYAQVVTRIKNILAVIQ
jgi:hypothetical protein